MKGTHYISIFCMKLGHHKDAQDRIFVKSRVLAIFFGHIYIYYSFCMMLEAKIGHYLSMVSCFGKIIRINRWSDRGQVLFRISWVELCQFFHALRCRSVKHMLDTILKYKKPLIRAHLFNCSFLVAQPGWINWNLSKNIIFLSRFGVVSQKL